MGGVRTETETVIKKILPYLERRGYDVENDLDFETSVQTNGGNSGFIDILVTMGKKSPRFLIEAKRIGKTLTNRDRDQAIKYAKSKEIDVPFVVVTNGKDIRCYNSNTKQVIVWDGKRSDKIPAKHQVELAIKQLRKNPVETNVHIAGDESLPFRQGLPLRQLNALFAKGHNTIRKIEKNEDSAFADFSKLLFLKLLEEKNDIDETFELPYSYKFFELAETPLRNADQVKNAINNMVSEIIAKTTYGEVLKTNISLTKPRTYLSLVKDLSSVSFCDCSIDSKGAAFEYYVRATLKGKKLGQYFTPRALVKLMSCLVGEDKIINAIINNAPIKVMDPACGTGGFLVYLMQDTLNKLKAKLDNREITKATYEKCVKRVKEDVFFGSDANSGVAASAKMNMIVAGDGHTHIVHEDSLSENAKNWSTRTPDCTLILTNPPFGTSESDSLTNEDMEQFNVNTSRGQYLFLQKMIDASVSGGEICTVIDEGVLNTSSGKDVRRYLMQMCIVKAVISLPIETFKPNKINVRASVLYLIKRDNPDYDLSDDYPITFCKLKSLGYDGSGEKIRGFDDERMYIDFSNEVLNRRNGAEREGQVWNAYDISSSMIASDNDCRLDYKYWEPGYRQGLNRLNKKKCLTIKDINVVETNRGISPSTSAYVDAKDGYALVIKSGTNISKFGELIIPENSDWIEKSTYDEYLGAESKNIVKKGDVLLASTGDGTLGKCCVFDKSIPAVADGHVTIIRVNKAVICPRFLADYLRVGYGSKQIQCLYSGSTGLIELTPEQVNTIVVDYTGEVMDIGMQKKYSKDLRSAEKKYIQQIEKAEATYKEIIDKL